MSALKVIMRVSFCWPQLVPASALRILRRGVARETRVAIWGEKVKWGSRVTPSTRGFLSKGSWELLRVTDGWVWDCWNCGVKRVMLDLGAEMVNPRSLAHVPTHSACAEREPAAVGMLGDEQESVKSSA